MNPVLVFAPEGYTTRQGKLMGRMAATEGLLRALIRHGRQDRLLAYLLHPSAMPHFAPMAAALGSTLPAETIPPARIGDVARHGPLLMPGPDIGRLAGLRALAGADSAFSLVGVTYTLSSMGVMRAIAELATRPIHPWDAVICATRSGLEMVKATLDAEEARLAERLGATRFTRPALPVIPLGIDCASFRPTPELRAEWRARIGAAEQDIVLLCQGRVSWHAKAHPWPMLAAAGRAARRLPPGVKLHLLVCGWSSNDGQEKTLRAQAQALCPEVALHRAGGAEPERRPGTHAGADAFILLSDNIQETFGLAVTEAMAAGLPCIVSDWDGFRDLVRDGVDGFRIPTTQAAPGTAPDLAMLHASGQLDYDNFLAHAVQLAAVDVAATAEAITLLATDPAHRRAMGEAARLRAEAVFDWSVIIPQYQALWAELAALRRATRTRPEPLDPTDVFADWPSTPLLPDTPIARDPAAPTDLAAMLALPAAIHPAADAARAAALRAVLEALPEGTTTPAALHAALPGTPPLLLDRALLWLLKTGFLHRPAARPRD
jgi:glycosyltransferase involved in cell wall biosynthesis